MHRKVVILGTGPAGLTAAIYAARACLDPLVIEGPQPGGQLTITTEVENYPGFSKGIQGPELMEEFRKQAVRFGSEIITLQIKSIDLSSRPCTLKGAYDDEEVEIKAESLILAMGASAKWLGIPGEALTPEGFGGRGVSACAVCDGLFFRDQEVVVVGGGDTAMEEAMFLTRFATRVTVIHRRKTLRASKIMQEKAFKNPKISFIWDAAVEEILGNDKDGVTGVMLKDLESGTLSEFKCGGVFIAIGHHPNTDLVRGQLELDEQGYIVTQGKSTVCSVPGVFACGDIQDPVYKQAVSAAGDGARAAIDAERFLDLYRGLAFDAF